MPKPVTYSTFSKAAGGYNAELINGKCTESATQFEVRWQLA
ncbi:hypothetical protein [Vibrio navarrensis]|nr:hypothetical protein [Vibrio navarrensis]